MKNWNNCSQFVTFYIFLFMAWHMIFFVWIQQSDNFNPLLVSAPPFTKLYIQEIVICLLQTKHTLQLIHPSSIWWNRGLHTNVWFTLLCHRLHGCQLKYTFSPLSKSVLFSLSAGHKLNIQLSKTNILYSQILKCMYWTKYTILGSTFVRAILMASLRPCLKFCLKCPFQICVSV